MSRPLSSHDLIKLRLKGKEFTTWHHEGQLLVPYDNLVLESHQYNRSMSLSFMQGAVRVHEFDFGNTIGRGASPFHGAGGFQLGHLVVDQRTPAPPDWRRRFEF